ncbi:hypothetical protein [Actinosynnema sp. ALI-1.44]|nr:hypothetical protein [Actinosynnema sp. ALI-1.44]
MTRAAEFTERTPASTTLDDPYLFERVEFVTEEEPAPASLVYPMPCGGCG